MSEKPESDDFDDDADLPGAGTDDSDYEFLLEDLGRPKRGAVPQGEPAWRKLEKYREQKQTAEQLSDFDDYDIGDDGSGKKRRKHRPSF
ncbi:hypothetical protein [Arenimonas sp.]|uniref:hypothetical protein n=1 Tax=Arenimonas sp. TaxID=1872635 RepID=UPI0039E2864C